MAPGTYLGASAGAAAAPPAPTEWAEGAESSVGAPDRRPALQFFFQPGDAAEFIQGRAVVDFHQAFLVQSVDMLDGDFDAVNGAEDAAAEFFEAVGEILDLLRSGDEQGMETIAECGIVRCESRQHSGMINRFSERGFQLPDALDDAGFHERAEIVKAVAPGQARGRIRAAVAHRRRRARARRTQTGFPAAQFQTERAGIEPSRP